MKSKFRYLFFCLLSTVCCLLFVSNVDAHKVNIYAYAENGMVHSESYFVDGTKCKNSVLEVFDERDKTKLLEGKTDEEGKFSFKIPKVTSMTLVLHASMGHQAEFTLGEDEVREAMGIKSRKSEVQSQRPNPPLPPFTKGGHGGITPELRTPNTEIEAIIERVLDKKLQPVVRMLVKLQESSGKPGFTEIVGGIGYIIGILGIIAYFKAKRIMKN
jgi:nickel transport protein